MTTMIDNMKVYQQGKEFAPKFQKLSKLQWNKIEKTTLQPR